MITFIDSVFTHLKVTKNSLHVSEQILNRTSAQLGYGVQFKLVHDGIYKIED